MKPSVPSEPIMMRVRSTRSGRIDERIEVVAADAPQHLRKAALDLAGVTDAELAEWRDRRAPRCCRRPSRPRPRARSERPKMRQAAVRQHHALLEHVIDRLAVEDRSRAARVVGHHAADGGAAGRRHVRGEAQVVLAERRVQLVEHDARLDARPLLVGIDLEDPVQVLRGVEHDARSDRLAGLRRAAASRRDRHAVPRRESRRRAPRPPPISE